MNKMITEDNYLEEGGRAGFVLSYSPDVLLSRLRTSHDVQYQRRYSNQKLTEHKGVKFNTPSR
jgi:hypothetical protein